MLWVFSPNFSANVVSFNSNIFLIFQFYVHFTTQMKKLYECLFYPTIILNGGSLLTYVISGITNLRFKPTYNPYTEPSMEIFAFHEGLGKWVEIGNSGMFRPEMLLPMGLPADVNVAGYGLSLERSASSSSVYNSYFFGHFTTLL